jgi:protein O-mannosyl-transferase
MIRPWTASYPLQSPLDSNPAPPQLSASLMDNSEKMVRAVMMCLLLGALTLAAFWPVVHCGFTNFDDPIYVTANPHVLGGLTLESIGWAFRAGYYANWHPLTWLSHMADVELFGDRAGGHHLTSLLLHIANTLLLFWVLQRMTGALGRSSLVAALFAVHPLHVESVAWISERKDVLSMFFFILTLWAYNRYVEGRRRNAECRMQKEAGGAEHSLATLNSPTINYLLSLLLFAFGLMSKPMVVTLPFVLLLLDHWPLRRLEIDKKNSALRTLPPLVLEKLPFFVLAAISTVLSYCLQEGEGDTALLGPLPLGNRLGNAAISYLRYVGKMLWPAHLAVLYPHPRAWPVWQVAVAVAVLLGLTLAAVRSARRHPYVPVGWFWYVGTLVPVIGLVQFGEQSIADRYTYIPMIGLFIVLAWGLWEITARWPQRYLLLSSAAVLVVVLLALGTRVQLQYWRTGRALLEHSLESAGGTAVIHGNLGIILAEEGNAEEAKRHFQAALRLQPDYHRARSSLVITLARQGKMDEATNAIPGLAPTWEAETRRQLGEDLIEQSKIDEAIVQLSTAARLDPTNAPIRERLGLTLAQAGRPAEASDEFAALVRLRPDAQAHYYFALSLLARGKPEQAADQYREAIRLKPDWPEALNDLAWMLATDARPELRNAAEAVRLAERACELSGHKEARFLGTLDAAYAEAGRFAEAITVAEQARNLALAAGDQVVADAATARLEQYRAGRAYIQPQP